MVRSQFLPGWRARVRDAALSWVGTPYHDRGQVKGAQGGVDCLTLLIGVYSEAGVIPWFKPPWYSPQQPMHVSGEHYVKAILSVAEPVAPPWLAGDILMFRLPGAPSSGHAGIYIGDGLMVHADGMREKRVVTAEISLPLYARTLSGGYGHRGVD